MKTLKEKEAHVQDGSDRINEMNTARFAQYPELFSTNRIFMSSLPFNCGKQWVNSPSEVFRLNEGDADNDDRLENSVTSGQFEIVDRGG